ncbi:MAG: hypothetical protein ACR2L6_12470 [Gemmatimonadaceae bacterium]
MSGLLPREGDSGGFGAAAGAVGAFILLPGGVLVSVFGIGFVIVAGWLVIPSLRQLHATRRRRAVRESRSEEEAG